MRRYVRTLFAVCLLIGLVPPGAGLGTAGASGNGVASRETRVDALFASFERGDRPGCAIGINEAGGVAYAAAYGTAHRRRGDALTTDSVFDIASVSKQITAAVVFLLAADGTLALSDDVRAWVPELEYDPSPTLDDLVHHVSGLPDYTELLDASYAEVTTTADALDALVEDAGVDFLPGRRFEYSNTNYFLLSVVAERATGRRFRDLVAERIFEPLGMEHSFVRDDADERVADLATGYAKRGTRFVRDVSGWQQTGDGAVHTTVTDLLRWVANLSTFAVGGPALRASMFAPGPRRDGGLAYGGGLSIDTFDGQLRVEHAGSWSGYSSDLVALPDEGTGIVVLCNRDDTDAARLAQQALRIWRAG